MLQTIQFPAGGRIVNARATFFRYESGGAVGEDPSIRVRADGQDLGLYTPGDAIELPQACSTWEVTPVSALCTGVVRLGIGRVQSARLVGQVEVIQADRARVLDSRKFGNTASVATPAAGNFASAQLFNGSTQGVAVRGVWIFSSDLAQAISVQFNTSQLPGTSLPVVSKRANNPMLALPAGIVTVRNVVNTTGPGGNPGVLANPVNIQVPAGAVQTRIPLDDGPWLLAPGMGLILASNTAVSGIGVYFEGEVFAWQ